MNISNTTDKPCLMCGKVHSTIVVTTVTKSDIFEGKENRVGIGSIIVKTEGHIYGQESIKSITETPHRQIEEY